MSRMSILVYFTPNKSYDFSENPTVDGWKWIGHGTELGTGLKDVQWEGPESNSGDMIAHVHLGMLKLIKDEIITSYRLDVIFKKE